MATHENKIKISLATACDERFARNALQLIASVQKFSPIFETIYLYDLGIPRYMRWCFSGISGVEIRKVEKFAPHYLKQYSWKPWVLLNTPGEVVLYLDAGTEVLKSLEEVVEIIENHGYFVVSQYETLPKGHDVGDIIPSDYYQKYDLDSSFAKHPVVAAGIVGYKKTSELKNVLQRTIEGVKAGDNLGWSKNELHRNTGINKMDNPPVRDCLYFRHDQTLFNIWFYKLIRRPVIQDIDKYGGLDFSGDQNQAIWNSRLESKYTLINKVSYNRLNWLHNLFNSYYPQLAAVYFGAQGLLLRATDRHKKVSDDE